MFQKQIWVKIVAVALTLCTLLMVVPLNVWADSPAEEPIQRMADAQPAESFCISIFLCMTYGNGATVGYTYDAYDRVTSISYDNAEAVRYVYDKSGNLYEVQDLENDESVRYSYDLTGRPTDARSSDGTYLSYAYDTFNRISQTGYGFAGNSANVSYLYGDSKTAGQKTGLIYGVKQNGSQTLSYTYDALARVASSKIHTSTPFVTEYTYLEGEGANSTTTLVKTMKLGSDTYGYTYDDLGNITSITKNGTVVESYEYDSLSQLTKVTNSQGVFEYTYDDGGNILSVTKDGEEIKDYTYGDASWKDLLTQFNGQTITYDNIGNPLSYLGKTLTWENGRQLSTIGDNISYAYNADGNRISKTVNNVETEYYWLDGVLLGEKSGTNTILYLYDDNGTKYGFDLNGTRYYYILNLQGDVIGILTSAGVQVVSYTYDAWGNLLSTTGSQASTIGQLNPIRYRGYYYDAETEFYFLNSRYYDPETGRFINADNQLSTGNDLTGMNLFAYCGNNPIMRVDPNGEAWWHWALGAVIVAATAFATVVTAGGVLPAIAAVSAVSSGVAATSVAATVSAAAFIGSATYLGASAMVAASNSKSVKDFNDQGNWGTVVGTAASAVISGGSAYVDSKISSSTKSSKVKTSKSTGKAFDSKGPSVQVGVDPNSVQINRPILPAKMEAIRNEARINGGINRPVKVWRNGVIYDGNHRVAYAREVGANIDVVIFPQ